MIDRRIAKIKLRRGNEAERTAVVFEEGELVYAVDSKKVYIGDGSTSGGNLVATRITVSPTPPNANTSGDIYFNQTEGRGYIRDDTEWKMIGGSPDDQTIEYEFGHFQLKNGGIMRDHIGEIHKLDGGLGSLSGEGVFINYDTTQFEVIDGVFKLIPNPGITVDAGGAIVNTTNGLSANVDNDSLIIAGNQISINKVYNSQIISGITPDKAASSFANSSSGLQINSNGMSIKTVSNDLDFDPDGNLRLNPNQFIAAKGDNGYQAFPTNFIMQWGKTAPLTANQFYTVLFPLSTWAICYNVQATLSYTSIINNNFSPVIRNITLSSFDIALDYSGTSTIDSAVVYWNAIGYLS
jgi:hypothetical protein